MTHIQATAHQLAEEFNRYSADYIEARLEQSQTSYMEKGEGSIFPVASHKNPTKIIIFLCLNFRPLITSILLSPNFQSSTFFPNNLWIFSYFCYNEIAASHFVLARNDKEGC